MLFLLRHLTIRSPKKVNPLTLNMRFESSKQTIFGMIFMFSVQTACFCRICCISATRSVKATERFIYIDFGKFRIRTCKKASITFNEGIGYTLLSHIFHIFSVPLSYNIFGENIIYYFGQPVAPLTWWQYRVPCGVPLPCEPVDARGPRGESSGSMRAGRGPPKISGYCRAIRKLRSTGPL